MPDRIYWDKKEEKEVVILSDLLECGRCLNKTFSASRNEDPNKAEAFVQVCLGCGARLYTNKIIYDEAYRFVPIEEYKKAQPVKQKEVEEETEEVVIKEASKQSADKKELPKKNSSRKPTKRK